MKQKKQANKHLMVKCSNFMERFGFKSVNSTSLTLLLFISFIFVTLCFCWDKNYSFTLYLAHANNIAMWGEKLKILCNLCCFRAFVWVGMKLSPSVLQDLFNFYVSFCLGVLFAQAAAGSASSGASTASSISNKPVSSRVAPQQQQLQQQQQITPTSTSSNPLS